MKSFLNGLNHITQLIAGIPFKVVNNTLVSIDDRYSNINNNVNVVFKSRQTL